MRWSGGWRRWPGVRRGAEPGSLSVGFVWRRGRGSEPSRTRPHEPGFWLRFGKAGGRWVRSARRGGSEPSRARVDEAERWLCSVRAHRVDRAGIGFDRCEGVGFDRRERCRDLARPAGWRNARDPKERQRKNRFWGSRSSVGSSERERHRPGPLRVALGPGWRIMELGGPEPDRQSNGT
jgi:hypothetical protein